MVLKLSRPWKRGVQWQQGILRSLIVWALAMHGGGIGSEALSLPVARIDLKKTWIYGPEKEQDIKAVILIFTDLNCGYCRKMHAQLPELIKAGIQVRYLAYPREGVGSASYHQLASAWCAKNRESALELVWRGVSIETKRCAHPLMDHMAQGYAWGIGGTPAVVLATGEILEGYVPAEELTRIILSRTGKS